MFCKSHYTPVLRLLGTLLILILALGCGDSQPVKEASLEQKVATIDAGTFISEDDISVKRIRYLLTSLETATGVPKEKIADKAATARSILRENYGREIKIQDLLEGANKAEAVLNKTVSLDSYFALVTVFASQ
jgi:hypothetical protein